MGYGLMVFRCTPHLVELKHLRKLKLSCLPKADVALPQFGKKLIWLTLGPGQIPSMMNCVSHIMVENLVMISDRTEN